MKSVANPYLRQDIPSAGLIPTKTINIIILEDEILNTLPAPVKAQLTKSTQISAPSERTKAVQEKINNSMKNDILNGAKQISLDLSQLSGENNLLKEQTGPTTKVTADSDVFFKDNLYYLNIAEDATYKIDGVQFSKNEVDTIKEVLKKAISTLPTVGSNLNYSDYAAMGIAINSVSSWADEKLTKDQSEVVKQSIQNYTDNMVVAERNMQEATGVKIDNSKYYGATISNDETDQMINYLKETVSKVTGQLYKPSVNASALQQSATNTTLCSSIKDLFANVDLHDNDALKNAYEEYKNMVKPAYQEYGLTQHLSTFYSEDINKFAAQISTSLSAMQSIGINRVDLYV